VVGTGKSSGSTAGLWHVDLMKVDLLLIDSNKYVLRNDALLCTGKSSVAFFGPRSFYIYALGRSLGVCPTQQVTFLGN
jgi:hypothetical protein